MTAMLETARGRDVAYTRMPYLIVRREAARRKEVYGSIDDNVVLQAQLLRGKQENDTVVVGMHPVGSPGYLPAFSQLARRGHHVIACATRYSMGDAALQMENALLDLAACVRDAKQRWGYERIILAGWSGGGALMAGYQAEAEHRTISRTAAGESTALADCELIPGDALAILAAHRSRHHLLTDFLDPSILDEDRPDEREVELNIYDPGNPHQPPYSPEYIDRYRAAQRERNRRITARAWERLERLRASGQGDQDHCFVVHGTMADPRWVDPTLDPNDREPGVSYLGDPQIANESTAGLARFTTTRSWLSQWSLDHAQVDAVEAAPRISVPVLTVVNSADDACPRSHLDDFHAGITHERKELQVIHGATHYFTGPNGRDHLEQASTVFAAWAHRFGFTTGS